MAILGIELNDVALAGVGPDGTVFWEPAYALFREGSLRLGQQALKSRRLFPRATRSNYFAELSEIPLVNPTAPYLTTADYAYAHLQHVMASCGDQFDSVVFAVPAWWSEEQLGLMLGIADELAIPTVGVVTSSVAATRREYPGQQLFHLEAGMNQFLIQELTQDNGTQAAASNVLNDFGYGQLEHSAVSYIARRLLECSRFDATQAATNEQLLYDRLPEWLAGLKRQAVIEIEIEQGEYVFTAELSAKDLLATLRVASEPLIQRLRALIPAGQSAAVALQFHASLDDFPGYVNMLAEEVAAVPYMLEPAAAARGAMRRAAQMPSQAGGYSLTRSLPWDLSAAELMPPMASVSQLPTHLVYRNKAYRLNTGSLVVGAELSAGEKGLVLESIASGISRRHFSIETTNSEVLLKEYGRYGTLLNGYPVKDSVSLRAGDVIAVGQPAEELLLVCEALPMETEDGA